MQCTNSSITYTLLKVSTKGKLFTPYMISTLQMESQTLKDSSVRNQIVPVGSGPLQRRTMM